MNRVAAIVPTYNRIAFVAECIRSLLQQTRPLDEIVVVDDGSSDGTADYVRQEFGDRVRVFRTQNGGKSAAINFGMQQISSDHVWICDDDDIASPDGCKSLLAELIDADDDVGFAFGHYRIFDRPGDGARLYPPPFWSSPDEGDVRISVMEDLHIFQFATLFRRMALDAVGPFDERLRRSQDLEMMIRLTARCRGIYVPETIFYQRSHSPVRGSDGDTPCAHERWLSYDRVFFPQMRDSNRSFCPSFAQLFPPKRKKRAELLQRAVIFGRRGMWDTAIPLLTDAAQVAQDQALVGEEHRLIARIIRHGLPSSALALRRNDAVRFAALRRGSRIGATICTIIGAALVGRMRHALGEKRWQDAARAAAMLTYVGGPTFPHHFWKRRNDRSLVGATPTKLRPHEKVTDAEKRFIESGQQARNGSVTVASSPLLSHDDRNVGDVSET